LGGLLAHGRWRMIAKRFSDKIMRKNRDLEAVNG
jgi:hypothetical protein